MARTNPNGKAAHGISLILVDSHTPGYTKGRNLKKMGLKAQDTSELFFDNVRERLAIAGLAVAHAEACYEWTRTYVKDRKAFGGTLSNLQVNGLCGLLFLYIYMYVCLFISLLRMYILRLTFHFVISSVLLISLASLTVLISSNRPFDISLRRQKLPLLWLALFSTAAWSRIWSINWLQKWRPWRNTGVYRFREQSCRWLPAAAWRFWVYVGALFHFALSVMHVFSAYMVVPTKLWRSSLRDQSEGYIANWDINVCIMIRCVST